MRVATVWSLFLVFGVAGCQSDDVGVAEVTEGPEASQAALASPEAADSLGAATLRYGQVDITAGPSDLDGWSPLGLSDRSEVFGQGFKCDAQGICAVPLLKRKADGRFEKVASNFLGNDVNKYGDVGGCVVKDPVSLAGQAAILRASGKVELIPPLRGETASCITKLSDGCVAVVTSVDASSTVTVYVLEGRRITPITVAGGSVEDVNDRGQIAGVISSNPDANRAYRFDSHTGKTTILTPVSTDPHSWAMGINSKGEVLGYSFAFDAIERVGKWNRNDVFETSFVEGTPEFPTVSNRLVWNESGLIIISYSLNDPNTYLVPKPGVRLALSGLVVNGPVAETLFVLQVNARADFVATSVADGRSFLFVRK